MSADSDIMTPFDALQFRNGELLNEGRGICARNPAHLKRGPVLSETSGRFIVSQADFEGYYELSNAKPALEVDSLWRLDSLRRSDPSTSKERER
jgi:hypothetical protein